MAYVREKPVVPKQRNVQKSVPRARNKKPIIQQVDKRTRQPNIFPSTRECQIVLNRMTPEFLAEKLKSNKQNPINQIATSKTQSGDTEIVALAKLFAGDWFNMRMDEPALIPQNPKKNCAAIEPFIDSNNDAHMLALATKSHFKAIVNLPNKRITTFFTKEAWENMVDTAMNLFQNISFENVNVVDLIGVRANRFLQTFEPNPFMQGTANTPYAIDHYASNMIAMGKVSCDSISFEPPDQRKTINFAQDMWVNMSAFMTYEPMQILECERSEFNPVDVSTSSNVDDSDVEV